jgi:hypothetical protein
LEHAYLTACHEAFAIAGIQEEMHDLDEAELPDSRLSMAHTSQDASSVKITTAQVVNDVIINATLLEGVPRIGLILRYNIIVVIPYVQVYLCLFMIIYSFIF